MVRRSAVLALTAIAVLVAALPVTAARADATIDAVADILRAESVYNDPLAELSLTDGQVDALRGQITATGLPIYIAILPEEDVRAYGSADALLEGVQESVGREGVYAIVAGNSFRAGSTSGSVRQIADSAFAENSANGVYAVLRAFVDGVDDQFNNSAATGTAPTDSGSSSSDQAPAGSGINILIPLAVIVVLGGVGFYFLRRRGKKQQAERLDAVRAVLNEDVTGLGERLGSFDLTDPRLDDAGRAGSSTCNACRAR